MKEVSVIVTTCNRKQFLKNAINSIKHQTYPVNEIIVVDDHSGYDIKSFLKEYLDDITLIINSSQKGSAYTYNKGIEESSSDYLTILNDDDIFHPYKIEKQLEIFHQHPDLGIVYCPIGSLKNDMLSYNPITYENNKWFGLRYLNNIGITPLIKKECFEVCGLFDTDLPYNEDRDLWYRIGKKYSFGFHQYPLYIEYNHHINRMSSSLKDICHGRKKLYTKHKTDFDQIKKYYSNLYFELAHENQRFGNYKSYISYMLKSIKYNPSQLFDFFSLPKKKIKGKKIIEPDRDILGLIYNRG